MSKDTPPMSNKTFFKYYTILFFTMLLCCFFAFIIYNKSFIWAERDGLDQHFTALVYYGDYLRGIVKNLFTTGSLSMPMWDFQLGLGEDILTTLSYYVIGDPLTWLSVFVPSEYTEYLYCLIIILKLYLAGIAFSLFCFRMKQDRTSVLAGSMAYVFCGYAMFASVRHPYFTNPMIFLPLLLIGVEKLLHREKPYFFIGMVFISCTSNFYFFYMLTILMVLYAIVRFFYITTENIIKAFIQRFLLCSACYCFGVGMAAFLFLPTVSYMLTSARADTGSTPVLWQYSTKYYYHFITNYAGSYKEMNWTILGITPLSIIAVIVLFSQYRKKFTSLKIFYVIGTIFLLIPFFGYALNGFAYAANRFMWAYHFVIAFILVVVFKEFFTLTHRSKLINYVFFTCYSLCSIAIAVTIHVEQMSHLITSLCIYGVILFMIQWNYFSIPRKYQSLFLFAATLIPIVYHSNMLFVGESGYAKDFVTMGKAYQTIDHGASLANQINDNAFHRTYLSGNRYSNTSILYDYNSTSSYFSLINGNVVNTLSKLGVIDLRVQARYQGFDNRTALHTLGATKYSIVSRENTSALPYGYKQITKGTDSTSYMLYENQMPLPLGYTYDSYTTWDALSSLNMVEQQQTMLDTAVLEAPASSASLLMKSLSSSSAVNSIPFAVTTTTNASLSGHSMGTYTITAYETNAEIQLTFDASADSEVYLYFGGIDVNFKSPVTDAASIWLSSNHMTKRFSYFAPNNNYYIADRKYTVNLGYLQEKRTQCTVRLSEPGTYSLDTLQVLAVPMNQLKQQVRRRTEDILENVRLENNVIRGTIDLDTDKLLCLSLPYNRGWSALVDGQPADVLQVNGMYSGIMLSSGTHSIYLQYETPYLIPGLLITGFSFSVLFILFIFQKRVKAVVFRQKKS